MNKPQNKADLAHRERCKQLFGDVNFSLLQATKAVIAAEEFNRRDDMIVRPDELAVLREKAKAHYTEKYGEHWEAMMPIVEMQYREAKRGAGVPPSGLNRADRRRMLAASRRRQKPQRRELPESIRKYLP